MKLTPPAADPVCGMACGKDALRETVGGREECFCSEACRGAFRADPARHPPRRVDRGRWELVLRDDASGVDTSSRRHMEHRARLRQWVEPLALPQERLSLHVIESADPAGALLELARQNHVDLIVLGAPGPSQMALAWWRSVASSVTANAHCSVHVVRVTERPPGFSAEESAAGASTGSA